jgi:hypothetical protein
MVAATAVKVQLEYNFFPTGSGRRASDHDVWPGPSLHQGISGCLIHSCFIFIKQLERLPFLLLNYRVAVLVLTLDHS